MKINKLYLTLAAGALSIVPAVAADPAPAAAKPEAPAKAEAPKADVWSKIPEVVAIVDGKPVTKAELISAVKAQLPNGEIPPQVTADMVAQAAPAMVEELVTDRLAKADFEARKPKVTKDDARKYMTDGFGKLPPERRQMITDALKKQNKTVEQFIEEQISQPGMLDKIAQEEFAKKVIFKDCETTDEEAKKFYDAHVNEFPEVVAASHILVRLKPDAAEPEKKAALDKINRIAEELRKNPAAFEEIAKKESDCPSKAQGGKLGEFQRRQMDPEFEKAAFALKTGELSGVVKSQFGYHVIRCDAAAHRVTFDALKNDLKQMLTQPKMERAAKEYVDGLKKQHKVEILVKAPALPAPAQAAPPAPAAPAPAPAAPAAK